MRSVRTAKAQAKAKADPFSGLVVLPQTRMAKPGTVELALSNILEEYLMG